MQVPQQTNGVPISLKLSDINNTILMQAPDDRHTAITGVNILHDASSTDRCRSRITFIQGTGQLLHRDHQRALSCADLMRDLNE